LFYSVLGEFWSLENGVFCSDFGDRQILFSTV
jgi:hypothetical protein